MRLLSLRGLGCPPHRTQMCHLLWDPVSQVISSSLPLSFLVSGPAGALHSPGSWLLLWSPQHRRGERGEKSGEPGGLLLLLGTSGWGLGAGG